MDSSNARKKNCLQSQFKVHSFNYYRVRYYRALVTKQDDKDKKIEFNKSLIMVSIVEWRISGMRSDTSLRMFGAQLLISIDVREQVIPRFLIRVLEMCFGNV